MLAALLFAMLVVSGTAALIGWAVTAVDRIEVTQERVLVERRLSRMLDGLVDDVNSASIWDDSVTALSGKPDFAWLQLNLGDYYADYMGHVVTLTFDGDGRLIAASRDSEPVAPGRESAFAAAVAPMVAEVRTEAATSGKRSALGFAAVANRQALVQVGAETWLVVASSVVPELPTVARPPADPVVVSAQPISVLLASMKDDLALLDPRFSATAGEGAASVALKDSAGRPLGRLLWTPASPGQGLLNDAAAVIAVVLLALLAASAALLLWVDRVGRHLTAKEDALTEARDRAEAANVAKSRFLGNMSHELRTPLNGVVGMAEIMAMGELCPVQRSRLDLLRESSDNLLKLIERLLRISRLERREVLIDRTVFDPAASAAAAAEAYREAAGAKGLALSLDCAAIGPRLGDEMHLRQVLEFLIDNAITYTEQGQVSIAVSHHEGAVRFVVADTGMGIAPDLLPQMFDVFVQADDSMTRRFEGAGIGLSICRNLVEAMGGRIAVTSEQGQGSVFTVDLPLPPAPAETAVRLAA